MPLMIRSVSSLLLVGWFAVGLGGQAPAPVDTSKIGPQPGAVVPGFSGTDQFGRSRTLQSSLGPKGAMLVFFRSADW